MLYSRHKPLKLYDYERYEVMFILEHKKVRRLKAISYTNNKSFESKSLDI